MCEDPQLSIIKYIFNKNNVSNSDESINSFFDNGISFPQFVSLIFKIPEIPSIKSNPKNIFQKKANNDLALKYLLDHNESIRKFNPTYDNNDKDRLLSLIFTKQYFLMTLDEIIKKSNIIFQSYGISIQKKSHITDILYINNLLHILTDGKIDIIMEIQPNKIDNLLREIFKIANVPLVINHDSFKTQNQYILFIQIQIIFEQFSDKINKSNDSKPDNSMTQAFKKETQSSVTDDSNSNISLDKFSQKSETQSSITDDSNSNISLDKFSQKSETQSSITNDSNSNISLDKFSQKSETQSSITDDSNSNISLENTNQNFDTKSSIITDSSSNISLNTIDNKLNSNTNPTISTIIDKDKSTSIKPNAEQGIKSNLDHKNQIPDKENINSKKINKKTFDEDNLIEYETTRIKADDINNIEDFNVNQKSLREIIDDSKNVKDKTIFNKNEFAEDLSLYQTVIAISKAYKLSPSFKNFEQSFQNNFITLFVLKFFNILHIENVIILPSSNKNQITKEEIVNFKNIVKFLRKQDKAFDLLVFQFNNSMEREYSAKLLFKNILNLFFLKQNRNEMIERLKILENGITKSQSFNTLCMLCKLLYQIIINKPTDIQILVSVMQQYEDIPNIFHEDNFFHKDDIYPDSFYYQLQFIFKKIDNSGTYKILEIFLKAENAFKNIKNTSHENNFIQMFISNIKAKTTITKIANFSFLSEKEEDNNEQKEENQIQQEFFKDRYKRKNQNINEDSVDFNDLFYQDFWNISDTNYTFENGIFFNKTSKSKEFSIIFNKIFQEIKINRHTLYLNAKFESKKFNAKIYKLFYYDENKNEWIYDSKAFEEFRNDNNLFEIDSVYYPLFFYFNSNEKLLIEINKYFIQGDLPPLLDDDNLFVYCIYGKTISSLLSGLFSPDEIERRINSQTSINPIFLMIHIPLENEKIMANINRLLIQIYSYFLFICNYTIILVDNNHLFEQIEDFKRNIIFSSYVYQIPQKMDNLEENYYNDENDDEKSVIFKNKSVFFLIYKNDCILNEQNDIIMTYNKYISDLTKTIDKSVSFHVIDINNFLTFKLFISDLTNQLYNNNSTISEIQNNLELLNIKEIKKLSGRYLSIRDLPNVNELLNEIVEKRYSEYKNKFPQKIDTSLLNLIDHEIKQFVPLFDTNFIFLYNQISTAKRLSFKENDFIKKELQNSSDKNITYITNFINSKKYLSSFQLNDIKKSHFQFLRNEFYTIIKTIDDMKAFKSGFQLVETQIKYDNKILEDLFKNFKQHIKLQNSSKKYDAQEDVKKGTNYLLKETERLREIKVEVQINKDLKSEIEQDF